MLAIDALRVQKMITYSEIFPGGSDGKASVYNAYHVGDLGSIPGSGRSPGEGNGSLEDSVVFKSSIVTIMHILIN